MATAKVRATLLSGENQTFEVPVKHTVDQVKVWLISLVSCCFKLTIEIVARNLSCYQGKKKDRLFLEDRRGTCFLFVSTIQKAS